jgi:hypothetical protein
VVHEKEEAMGEAREILDQLTEAFFNQDYATVEELYAPDAVAVTLDQGELKGARAAIEYTKQFIEAFPDVKYEPLFKHESGNTAIDEGWIVGTNSGPLPLPLERRCPLPASASGFGVQTLPPWRTVA